MVDDRVVIFYKNGEIVKQEKLKEDVIAECNGMKVKCLLNNNEEKIGYANVYCVNDDSHYDGSVHDIIELYSYKNLTNDIFYPYENISKYETIYERIMIADILKIEAILYSNPRWGCVITNEFK